jgi:hypothetical protein
VVCVLLTRQRQRPWAGNPEQLPTYTVPVRERRAGVGQAAKDVIT